MLQADFARDSGRADKRAASSVLLGTRGGINVEFSGSSFTFESGGGVDN